MIKVIKKDGTKEEFNVQKVVVAVNKSAYRALVTFTEEELDFYLQLCHGKSGADAQEGSYDLRYA